MKSDNKTKTLHELCVSITDCPHSTPKWTDNGNIVLRNSYIKNGKLDLSNPSYTDEVHYRERIKRAKPGLGDIVITREAPMGEVCIIPENVECCLGQRMVLLKPNAEICDNHYLLYCLMAPSVQHQISWSEGTGTTVSNLRIPHLEQLKIPFLPIRQQKAIAAVLSALDDKIELNNRINQKLEEMAQAIFKSWFVDFEPFGGAMPDDWRIAEFSSFISPRVEKIISDDKTPMLSVTNTGIMLRDSKFNKKLASSTTKVKLAKFSDLVFGNSRHTLNWGIVRIPAGGVSSVYNVFSVADDINTNYLESFIKANIEYFSNIIRSTTRDNQSIDISALMQKSIYLPPRSLLAEYYAIENPLTAAIQVLVEESSRLAEIRDTLLPRLMSGEIDVAHLGNAK